MKKILLLIIAVFFLLNIVAAENIAYIVKSVDIPSEEEISIENILEQEGYTVDIFDSDLFDPDSYDMILVGSDVQKVENIFDNTKYKTLFLNAIAAKHAGFSRNNGITRGDSITIDTSNHAITSGFSVGDKRVYDSRQDIVYLSGCLAKNVKTLVYRNVKSRPVIYTVDKNSRLLNGGGCGDKYATVQVDERNLFFGINKAEYWNNNAEQLFLNGVEWVLIGQDMDGDGFYSDDDCDDTNASINPDAEEIPYDGVDNDCSGEDLADVDNDGYCLEGYEIQSIEQCFNDMFNFYGTDCDDSSDSINPGQEEIIDSIDQNCQNDAPLLVQEIPDINWNEDSSSQMYNFNNYFIDPDGDNMSFSIYDGSENDEIFVDFDDSELFKFHSGLNWFGSGWVIFKAYDSENSSVFNISNNITLNVNPVNDAPEIEAIEDKFTYERGLIALVVNATDIDNNHSELTYGINNADFEQEGNVFSWNPEIGDAGEYVLRLSVSDGEAVTYSYVNLTVYPAVVVNEFVSDPEHGNEWVEVYNAGSEALDFSECYISDFAEHKLYSSQTINQDEFLVLEYSSSILNNGGDLIKIVCSGIVLDQVTYGNLNYGQNVSLNAPTPVDGKSAGRIPDGNDTDVDSEDFHIIEMPTKGLPYNADLVPPVVILISPEHGTDVKTEDVGVSYTVIDNQATSLICEVYSDINGNFESIKSQTAFNGSESSFILKDVKDGEYMWNVRCSDGVSYSFSENNWSFIVNDTPYLIQEIGNTELDEDTEIKINLSDYFGDEDEDSLSYRVFGLMNIDFSVSGEILTLVPQQDWNGDEESIIQGCDSEKCVNSSATLTVNPVNDAPSIILIGGKKYAEEEEDIFLTVFANDIDSSVLSYSINDSRFTQQENNFTWQTGFDDSGVYYFEIGVSDGFLIDTEIVEVEIDENDAPVINSFSPAFNPKIPEDGTQTFSVVWSDEDNPENVEVRWYQDGLFVEAGDSYEFEATGEEETYFIRAVVDDGEFEIEKEWQLITSRVPIADTYDGDTTDFSKLNESDLECVFLVLEKTEHGKIEFIDCVDLRNVVDFDNYAGIQNGIAGINSNVFPSFKNKRANISFYNLNFPKIPAIYYSESFTLNPVLINDICSICSSVRYNTDTGFLEFQAESFSSFMAGQTLTCRQQGGNICSIMEVCEGDLIPARDTEVCCSQKCSIDFTEIERCDVRNNDIDIDLQDPEEDDEYFVGDIIFGSIEIKNKFEDDKDFEIEIFFYDLTEQDELESIEEELSVDEDEEEELDFEIKVPYDSEKNNENYIYVLVTDEDNESICNDAFVKLDIEREKYNLEIQEINIPDSALCRESVQGEIVLRNTGRKDLEDIFVKVSSEGIDSQTEEFELKDSKKIRKDFLFFSGEKQENYTLNVDVFFENERVGQTKNIFVSCDIEEEVKEIKKQVSTIKLEQEEQKARTREIDIKISKNTKLILLNLFLGIGTVILIWAILILLFRR
jgi:hypothetical protein